MTRYLLAVVLAVVFAVPSFAQAPLSDPTLWACSTNALTPSKLTRTGDTWRLEITTTVELDWIHFEVYGSGRYDDAWWIAPGDGSGHPGADVRRDLPAGSYTLTSRLPGDVPGWQHLDVSCPCVVVLTAPGEPYRTCLALDSGQPTPDWASNIPPCTVQGPKLSMRPGKL